MSDCGGMAIGLLAAPLMLVVLLVAGVGYLALQGAKLVGNLAIQGIQLAGTALAAGVRAASHAIAAAGTFVVDSAGRAAQWAGSLFESAQVQGRLHATAQRAYAAATNALSAASASAGSGLTVAGLPAGSAMEPIRGGSPTPSHAAGTQSVQITPGALAIDRSPVTLTAITGSANASGSFGPAASLVKEENAGRRQVAIEALARAQAASAALDSELPLKLVVEQRHAVQVAQASESLAGAQAALRSGDVVRAADLANRAETLIATALHDSHQHLVRAERATIAATVGNTLQDRGYEVRLASGEDGVALVGRREHHTLAMLVHPGGRLEMDMAGFEGSACDPEVKALVEGLRANGLIITHENLQRHGRFEGGALIRKARRSRKSLEVALAEMMTGSAPQQAAAPASGQPVRRRSRLTDRSEAERLRQARAWMWGQAQDQKGGR